MVFGGLKHIVSSTVTQIKTMLPNAVEHEISDMLQGAVSLKQKYVTNYRIGTLSAAIEGKGNVSTRLTGIYSSIKSTKISKEEIPSLFTLLGTPFPLGTPTGYIIGKIVISKPVIKTAQKGSIVLASTYSKMRGSLKI